jgi:hypothetical protein
MPFMDRPSFIALLNQLGDPEDSQVVVAAREVDRRMKAANLQWDDLLRPAGAAEDEPDAGADMAPLDQPTAPASDDYALIDRILGRSGVSDELREELTGMKSDIADGQFSERDRKYLQSLDARLSRQG